MPALDAVDDLCVLRRGTDGVRLYGDLVLGFGISFGV
jgi:hypothetical protein